MSRREELLMDHVYIVGGKFEENVPAPNGVVDERDVEGIQHELLTNMIEHLGSTLIDVKKSYPDKDTMDLGMVADFVVMRRKEFDELFRETPVPITLEVHKSTMGFKPDLSKGPSDIPLHKEPLWDSSGTNPDGDLTWTTSMNGEEKMEDE